MKTDDFDEDEDFSLDDASEEDADDGEAFSAGEEDAEEEDDDDEGDDALPSDESDFDDAPKRPAKRAKTAKASPRKKPAAAAKPKKAKAKASPATVKPAKQPSAVKSTAPSVKASPVAAKKSGASAPPVAAPITAGDAEGVVLDYMRKTNRPYSMLNVFENLHRAIAKPSLTKLLDKLVNKGELKSKTYGKAVIYYLNQDQLPAPSEEERAQVEVRIKELEDECVQVEQELRASEAALASVNSQLSDADLDAKLRELSEETQTLAAKLETLEQPNRAPVSPGRKDKLKRRFTSLRTAWVTRKRIATEALDQIADGMEKKPKVVMELCGIETDADAGVKQIPSI